MKKLYLISFYIFLFFFTYSCGIPQVLPYLNIPIADKNSYSNIEQLEEFTNATLIFTCTNKETYFNEYWFFYLDANNILNRGYFFYFDEEQKPVVLEKIPMESELAIFKSITNFSFTFYLNKNRLTGSSLTQSIRDTYSLLQEDKSSDISDLYASGKSITIYIIPVGIDESGKLYVYTPAFSTSSNKVTFSFK